MRSILKRTAAAAIASALALSLAGCGGEPAGLNERQGAARQAAAESLGTTYRFGAIEVPVSPDWAQSSNSSGDVVTFSAGEDQSVFLIRTDVASELESSSPEDVLWAKVESSFSAEPPNGFDGVPMLKGGRSGGSYAGRSFSASIEDERGRWEAVGEAYIVGTTLYWVQCSYVAGSGSELEAAAEAVLAGTVVDESGGGADPAAGSGGSMRVEDIGSMPSLEGAFLLKGDGSSFDYLDRAATDRKETVKGVNEEEVEPFAIYSGLDPAKAEAVDATGGEKIVLIGTTCESVKLSPVTETGYWQGFDSADLGAYEEVEGVSVDSLKNAEGFFDQAAVSAFFSELGIERRSLFYTNKENGDCSLTTATGKIWRGVDSIVMYRSGEERTLSAGWYEGTSWVDGVMLLDDPYCCADLEGSITAPVEKTKDGYFAVDASGAGAGLYVLEVSTPSGYVEHLVEIK